MCQRQIAAGVAVVLAGVLAAGCDGGGEKGSAAKATNAAGGANPGTSSKARKAFDPPTRVDPAATAQAPKDLGQVISSFGLNSGAPGARVPVSFDGTNVYYKTGKVLQLLDSNTGAVRASIGPKNEPASDDAMGGPASIVTVQGKKLAVAVFAVKVAGSGSTGAVRAIEVVAVTAEDLKQVWSTTVNLPAPKKQSMMLDAVKRQAVILGVKDTTMVFGLEVQDLSRGMETGEAGTFAINLVDHTIVWKSDDLIGYAVAGDTVIGGTIVPCATVVCFHQTGLQPTALSVSNGAKRWSMPGVSGEMKAFPIGTRRALVIANAPNATSTGIVLNAHVVDAATGSPALSEPWDTQASSTAVQSYGCVFDAAAITVCAGQDLMVAIDENASTWLWKLPDAAANRTALKLTYAWHGAVYTISSENGPVVLDAKTGVDKETKPGAVIYTANEYLAVGAEWDASTKAIKNSLGVGPRIYPVIG